MCLSSGDADLALCGASESAFMPAIVNGFSSMKALLQSKPGDRCQIDPAQASRPFSIDRAGFVMAEGAAMLVLATEAAVHRLDLEPQAELLGYAMNSDGYHMAMPSQERITECVTAALARARVTPGAIDYYNAHGTSTTLNDQVESHVVKSGFRRSRPPTARQFDQGGSGTWPRRGRGDRGGRLRPGVTRPDDPSDHQLPAGSRARP